MRGEHPQGICGGGIVGLGITVSAVRVVLRRALCPTHALPVVPVFSLSRGVENRIAEWVHVLLKKGVMLRQGVCLMTGPVTAGQRIE